MAPVRLAVLATALLLTLAVPAGLAEAAHGKRPPLVDRTDPCGCNPVLVGFGHSRGGQPWALRYGVRRRTSYLTISLPEHGTDDGGGQSWPGFRDGFQFTISFGDGFAAPDPVLVSGATSLRVRRLRITFGDRPPLVVHPWRAPAHLRKRFTFLRDVRFFVTFFDGGDGTFVGATAYDNRGRRLSRFPPR